MNKHTISSLSNNPKNEPSGIVAFAFQGQEVRTVVLDGEVAFVGKDVCERLGYADPTNAMKSHCKGVVKRHPLQTSGGLQDLRILSEPDVLRLIIKSKLPEAKEFERWVFEVVLPSIRKTGAYSVTPHVDVAGIDQSARKVIGGMIHASQEKYHARTIAAVSQDVGSLQREVAALKSVIGELMTSFDPTGAFVTNYRPMLAYVEERGIPSKGRGGLVRAMSRRCCSWMIRNSMGDMVRCSRETGRHMFKVDGVSIWMKSEGGSMIRSHMDKIIGQQRMELEGSDKVVHLSIDH